MNKERIQTSWDDGKKQDLRLADLLRQYEVPATFYIPNSTELSIEEIKGISIDFEIGGHTVNHIPLTDLNKTEARWEIKWNKRWLEDIIGRPLTSFCYPKGYYTQRDAKLVKEAGFQEARTVKRLSTSKPKKKFEIETTIHVYPNHKDQGDWLQRAKEIWDSEPDYFHLWGHSWELDKFDLWGELEEFLRYI
jgi:peptidoglycan-N-acetylglucosamine deacetylase